MKLFIFETSQSWSFCYGAFIVIAENYNQAVELGKREDRSAKFFRKESSKYKWDCWVLTKVLSLDKKKYDDWDIGVITFKYNNA